MGEEKGSRHDTYAPRKAPCARHSRQRTSCSKQRFSERENSAHGGQHAPGRIIAKRSDGLICITSDDAYVNFGKMSFMVGGGHYVFVFCHGELQGVACFSVPGMPSPRRDWSFCLFYSFCLLPGLLRGGCAPQA